MATKKLSPARWNTVTPTEEAPVALMDIVEASPTPEPDDIADPPVPEGMTVDELVSPQALDAALRAGKAAAAIMNGEDAPPTLPALPNASIPLLQAFAQHLTHKVEEWYMDHHKRSMLTMDDTMRFMKTWLEGVSQHNEHATYSLAHGLEQMAAAGIGTPPYQVTLHVKTPMGFGMDLVITKPTSEALIEELGRLEPWLRDSGYQAA
jgi:hypothetical protein